MSVETFTTRAHYSVLYIQLTLPGMQQFANISLDIEAIFLLLLTSRYKNALLAKDMDRRFQIFDTFSLHKNNAATKAINQVQNGSNNTSTQLHSSS